MGRIVKWFEFRSCKTVIAQSQFTQWGYLRPLQLGFCGQHLDTKLQRVGLQGLLDLHIPTMRPLSSQAFKGARRGRLRFSTPSKWICGSCQPRRIAQARWSSCNSSVTGTPEKPYYITTPIFYVNAGMNDSYMLAKVVC